MKKTGNNPANALRDAKARAEAAEEALHWIGRPDLAELLGTTSARVSQLATDGVLISEDGRYPRAENVRRVCNYLRGRTDLRSLRAEELRRKIELADIALSKARKEVLLATDVEEAWSNLVLIFRQRFLRMANKVAPRLPFCKSENEMETVIDNEVREILLELSRTPLYGDAQQQTTTIQTEPPPQAA